jgi:hypothetical protein
MTTIAMACRDRKGAIARYHVDIHDGFPTEGEQPDLFAVEPYSVDDARADITHELKEAEGSAPRVVLACLPGGKTQ